MLATSDKIELLCAVFIAIIISASPAISQKIYQREVLSEIGINEMPLPLRISLDDARPFAIQKDVTYGLIISGVSFCLNNIGKLITADHGAKEIIEHDFDTNRQIKFSPVSDYFNMMQIIRTGPNDEIYVELAASDTDGKNKSYKLVRYSRTDSSYVLDKSFLLQEQKKPFADLRICPDYYIYYKNIGKSYPESVFTSLAPNSPKPTTTGASCRNSNGNELCLETSKTESGNSSLKILDARTKSVLAQFSNNKILIYPFLKATLDNKVIVIAPNTERIELPNNKSLVNRIPTFLVFDLETGNVQEIATSDLARDDYKYYSFSQISCNFLGDLLAVAVYFNNPGEITGDEKIVFYRWRLE